MNRHRLRTGENHLTSLEPRLHFAFGQFDTTWANDGRVIIDEGQSTAFFRAVSVFGDKIYAAGDRALIRFTSAGAIDSSFGDDGRLALAGGQVVSEAVDADGSIFIVQTTSKGSTSLLKFLPSGAPDDSFADHGKAAIAAPIDVFAPSVLDVSASGILVGGVASHPPDTYVYEGKSRLYRLNLDGTPDLEFGAAGVASIQLGTLPTNGDKLRDYLETAHILGDGKIAIGGMALTYTIDDNGNYVFHQSQLIAARLLVSGTLDATYGAAGLARINTTAGATLDDPRFAGVRFPFGPEIGGIGAALDDGSMILAGRGLRNSVARFNSAGKIVYTTFEDGEFPLTTPRAMSMLADGRAVLMGDEYSPIVDATSPFLYRGPILATVSSSGEVSNWVQADDLNDSTAEVSESRLVNGNLASPAMTVAPDGALLVAGADTSTSGFEIEKLSPGNATDPRPDTFAHATTNALLPDRTGIGAYLAFYDTASESLKFDHRERNGQWDGVVTVDADAFCGMCLSMTTDVNDQPIIAYYDGANADLKIARTSDHGATWSTQTVDSRGLTGVNPSVAVTDDGAINVAYYRKSGGDLRFATLALGSNQWQISTIDSTGDVGRNLSMVNSSDLHGQPHRLLVAYSDDTRHFVNLARQLVGGGWKLEHVNRTSGDATSISILAEDGFDPSIAYYDSRLRSTKFFTRENATSLFWDGPSDGLRELTSPTEGIFNSMMFGVVRDDARPQIYSYNAIADHVTLFSDSFEDTWDIIDGGGRYLSVDNGGQFATIAAYRNTHAHALVVRSIFSPRDDTGD